MSLWCRFALFPSHIWYVRSSFLCVFGGNVVVICIFMPSPATVITSLQHTRLRTTYVIHNTQHDHVLLKPPSPGQPYFTLLLDNVPPARPWQPSSYIYRFYYECYFLCISQHCMQCGCGCAWRVQQGNVRFNVLIHLWLQVSSITWLVPSFKHLSYEMLLFYLSVCL